MSKKNLLSILLMVVSWSCYFILCKICITTSGSPFIAGLLLRIMTFVFLSIYWKVTRGKNKFKIEKEPLLFTILIGSVAFTFDALINVGFQYVPVFIGTVLLKTEILFVLLISLIFFKIKIKKWNYLFIILMLFGAVLCMDMQSLDVQFSAYSLLFIASAALNAGCAFGIKHIQEKYEIDSFTVAYTNNLVSIVWYAVCTSFFGSGHISSLFSEKNRIWYVIGVFLLCSICQTCLMITYYRNLKVLPVWVVKASLLSIPALSLIIEIVYLQTSISLLSFMGFALVLLGGLGIIINSKNTQ